MQTPATGLLFLVSVGLMGTLQVQSHPSAVAPEAPLDMAPTSFDDQYVGCTESMIAALPALNDTEFRANEVYAKAWTQAKRNWSLCRDRKHLPPGFRDEHGVALLAYTAEGLLYREFNVAVRRGGSDRDYYLHHFNFKTFHFLLTQALQLIVKDQKSQCRHVYRGVRDVRLKPSGVGVTVRLGSFTSTSLNKKKAEKFGKDTFFDIKTCLGAPIWGYSCFPREDEVLIPPFETFQVANVSQPAKRPIYNTLKAQGKHSTYNCEYIRAKKCKSGPCHLDSSAWGQGSLSTAWVLWMLLGFLVVGPSQGCGPPLTSTHCAAPPAASAAWGHWRPGCSSCDQVPQQTLGV